MSIVNSVFELFCFSRPRPIKGYWPEAVSITAFIILAGILRSHGHITHFDDADGQSKWAYIVKVWPILMGADTLLALQAMLRFAILVPLLVRGCTSTPVYGDCAALWLVGALARFYLFVAFRSDSAYRLDGPLGGTIPFFFETPCLPILLGLAWNALRTRPLQLTAAAMAAAVSVALQNYLRLEGGGHQDQLFMLANVCDLEASIAYLITTLFVDGTFEFSVTFTNFMMPVQALLAGYYFETVFQYDSAPAGAGNPIAMYRIGAMTQLAIYCIAASLHAAGWKWNSRKVQKALCAGLREEDHSEV